MLRIAVLMHLLSLINFFSKAVGFNKEHNLSPFSRQDILNYVGCHVKCVFFLQILTKTGYWQIFVNVPNMTSRDILCRQIDRHKADSCFMQLLCKCILTWTRCKKTGNYLICFHIYCPEIRILNFVTYYFWGQLQLQLSEITGRERLQSFGVRETKGCKRSIKIDDNALARKVVVIESCIWGWRICPFRPKIFGSLCGCDTRMMSAAAATVEH